MPGFEKERIVKLWEGIRHTLHEKNAKVNMLIAAGLIGMVLLCLSEWLPSTPASPSPEQNSEPGSYAGTFSDSFAIDLENRLQDLIESVEGAGHCEVMVTLSEGEQTVYATDTDQGDNATRSEHVLIGDNALVESVKVPTIQGVAVLCEGGNDVRVQNTVTELIRSLTGIGANHITVTKMVASQ